jgi:UDPglucose--hexose-1-phosphate uridylyltransferase
MAGIREIRINPIIPSESVLIATARGMRPRQAEAPAPRDARVRVDECPFCPGNEAQTPPTILATPERGDWQIRVVRNLYPVVADDDPRPPFQFGLQQAIDGYGRHELIIDHRYHGIALHEMAPDHLQRLFAVIRGRMEQLCAADERIRFVLAFKNFGPAAGASMKHTHSQMIALPVIPQNLLDEIDHSRRYHRRHGRCIFCTLIDEALTFEATLYSKETGEIRRQVRAGELIVARNPRCIAVKPFASRYEWEVYILPTDHQADFLRADDETLSHLAAMVGEVMGKLDRLLGGVQYNLILHSAPRRGCGGCANSFHWHLEITPRTSIPSGFELGSGLFVNTLAPEEAAEQLRRA